MIIDTTQTKVERQMQEVRWRTVGYFPIRENTTMIIPKITLTNEQKEAIIAQALKSDEGRKQLMKAMVEPVRCGGLEYNQFAQTQPWGGKHGEAPPYGV
ncbi:MAG: hypothetical protein ACXAC5_03355 [Promethearchaeota archaeon]|jgi:hypothetical protein